MYLPVIHFTMAHENAIPLGVLLTRCEFDTGDPTEILAVEPVFYGVSFAFLVVSFIFLLLGCKLLFNSSIENRGTFSYKLCGILSSSEL
jgi:hypothetical protein